MLSIKIVLMVDLVYVAEVVARLSLTITTQYHILIHYRYIAGENIVRKGEIACNKQFLLFSQCFLSYKVLSFHFKVHLKCRLEFV